MTETNTDTSFTNQRTFLIQQAKALVDAQKRADQLQHALTSRVVLEQAKGVLHERLSLDIEEAFQLLRYAARSSRQSLHELARQVVTDPKTPAAVSWALARQQRWRTTHQRERLEAQKERLSQQRPRWYLPQPEGERRRR